MLKAPMPQNHPVSEGRAARHASQISPLQLPDKVLLLSLRPSGAGEGGGQGDGDLSLLLQHRQRSESVSSEC